MENIHLKNGNSCVAFCLLFFLIFTIYSNTFNASWHFDDKPNIINNYGLHLQDLQPESLFQTFFSNPTNPWASNTKLYRPIACLTFALNWYFCKDNVAGYHIVNILIHLLAAFFLFLAIQKLSGSPKLKNRFKDSSYFIALLAAVFWAVNPIQTQAVTYIIQRMASLATLFFILSLYFYIAGRLASFRLKQVMFFFGSLTAFILGVGCKENVALLPFSLILLELIFFQDFKWQVNKRSTLFVLGIICSGFIIGGLVLYFKHDLFFFLKGYTCRPFSLTQRLMTECRILIFYLSQLFFPAPYRLSIEHDILISTSLFKPWTTLPAILSVICLISAGLAWMKKWPLFSFAILFFFLNHIVESSFLPLELVFEHRNYLPSLFLFFPVAAGCNYLIEYLKKRKYWLSWLAAACIIFIIFGLGMATYTRNKVWATEKSLWQDAMQKAPARARPVLNVIFDLVHGKNANPAYYEGALKAYRKTLELDHSRKPFKPGILIGMAGIYTSLGKYQKALELYQEVLNNDHNNAKARFELTGILIKLGKLEQASENADLLVSRKNAHEGYLNRKGFILLKQNRPREALPFFQKALKMAPYFQTTLLNIGSAFSLSEDYTRADWFFKKALHLPPENMAPCLLLIENSLKANKHEPARYYTNILLSKYSLWAIKAQLNSFANDAFLLPIDIKLMRNWLKQEIMHKAQNMG